MQRLLVPILFVLLTSVAQAAETTHALSMYGDVKYPPEFRHFDYVNAAAPKGGQLTLGVNGTFDSFNPFIPKGVAAAGLNALNAGYIWDSLTTRSMDEPFTEYGLIAASMEVPEDRSWVLFHINKAARFADGTPVTAHDVKFSFETLVEQGRPLYGFYYGSVTAVEVLDEHRIKFTFGETNNRELPLIIGQLPVLPAHYWKERDFTAVNMDKPMGSGPYELVEFKPGKRVVYQRREDYWGANLPVNVGHYNFDRIVFEYFLDETVILEAFKGGAFDLRAENSAKNWATAYDSPALRDGRINKAEFPHSRPAGMQGFVFNLRRPLFQDRTLRQALSYALDFEWSNQNLFYGQYTRSHSYFQNSPMAATALPDEAELALLEPYRDQLPAEVFTQVYTPPETNGNGSPRANLRTAQSLLKAAGYSIRDNVLHNPQGKPVKFEILLRSPAFERITLPFIRNLKVLGVQASVRTVDTPQYIERLRKFDFDMVVGNYGQSTSPGNEQRDYWSSAAADRPESRNYMGLKDPVVDALVESLISSPTREDLVVRCRALDRVLQWGFYVIPHWHISSDRIAYRSFLAHPETLPPYGLNTDTWWHTEAGK